LFYIDDDIKRYTYVHLNDKDTQM